MTAPLGRAPALAALLLAAAGLACGGAAVPRDQFYRLLLSPPGPPAGEARLPGVLVVEPLRADGLLGERPLLYSGVEDPLRLHQYHYHYWVDDPPRMIQEQLVLYLRGAGLARVVTTPRMRLEPRYVLAGRVLRLERVLGGPRPAVVLELELLVRNAEKQLVWGGVYREDAEAEDDDVGAAVAALNRALDAICQRFVRDAALF